MLRDGRALSDETKERASENLRFAAAVASFGMLLRDSPHKGDSTWELVEKLATGAKGDDAGGYRAEFLELVELASELHEVKSSASRR